MSLVKELRTEWDALGWTANRRDLFRKAADEIEDLQAVVEQLRQTANNGAVCSECLKQTSEPMYCVLCYGAAYLTHPCGLS